MNTNYQILKLTNGENIICDIKDQNENDVILEVTTPLKMDIMSHITREGIQEGLALTRWVQPFTDEKDIAINKSAIVTMVPASLGMSKYYEYVLKNIREMKLVESSTEDIETPTSKELEQIEWEEDEEMFEVLKKDTITIH